MISFDYITSYFLSLHYVKLIIMKYINPREGVMAQTFKNTVSFLMRIQCSSKVTGKIILQKSNGNHHQSGVLDDDLFCNLFILSITEWCYYPQLNNHSWLGMIFLANYRHSIQSKKNWLMMTLSNLKIKV